MMELLKGWQPYVYVCKRNFRKLMVYPPYPSFPTVSNNALTGSGWLCKGMHMDCVINNNRRNIYHMHQCKPLLYRSWCSNRYLKQLHVQCNHFCEIIHGKEYRGDSRSVSETQLLGSNFEDSTELETSKLYPDDEDLLLQKINCACSVEDIYKVLKNNWHVLSSRHLCQAVTNLWELQKVYGSYAEDMVEMHCQAILSNPMFSELCERLESQSSYMDDKGLVCLLMYLLKIGAEQSSTLVRSLLMECQSRCLTMEPNVLSRYSVALSEFDVAPLHLLGQVADVVNRQLAAADANDLFLYAVCLENAHVTASDGLKARFLRRVWPYVENRSAPLFTVLRCLDIGQSMASVDTQVSNEVLRFLLANVDSVSSVALSRVGVMFREQGLLQRELVDELSERAVVLLDRCCSPLESVSLLPALTRSKHAETHARVEQLLLRNIPEFKMPVLIRIAGVITDLQISSEKVLDDLCEQIIKLVTDQSPINNYEIPDKHLTRLCNCFVHLSKWPHLYRNRELEIVLHDLLVPQLKRKLGLQPWSVAMIAQYMITLNIGPLPEVILERIAAMAYQFNVRQIGYIVSGFETVHRVRSQSRLLLSQLSIVSRLLHRSLLQQLSHIESLSTLNQTLSQVVLHNQDVDDNLLCELMDQYSRFLDDFQPHHMLTTARLILKTRYHTPELATRLCRCVAENRTEIGRAFTMVLYACYLTNTTPSHEALAMFSEVLLANTGQLTTTDILNAALSLSLFQSLSKSVVDSIFQLEFLEAIDREIEESRSLAFTNRLRSKLMQLNRIVCLDYPEYGVPWFHEQYCNDSVIKASPESHMFADVTAALSDVIGGAEYLQQHVYTPYYYHLDLECILNGEHSPISCKQVGLKSWDLDTHLKEALPADAQRLAICIHPPHSFCINVRVLLGGEVVRTRHLEIMGYKVVHIPHFEWNSMHLSDQAAKMNYLHNKIFS
ncbi:PREDICTED: FAST kinase domain-containing protein 1-like [Priapulus caudatus]|uniref:FAST kinase domain-containing protein 1-like n=1 Tax=Priapulus caudatus TaxID=37621 RepID=A0ABM1DSH7_PRICU|nr:PREDICTED: FAST kinase domain-containing protein 1-like [Priapulus caudatus]